MRRLLAMLTIVATAACGSKGAGSGSTPDGSTDEGASEAGDTPPPTPFTGKASFDVVARLTAKPPQFPAPPNAKVPPMSRFSLTLDAGAKVIVAGGGGTAQTVPVTVSADGRTFTTTIPVTVRTPLDGCANGIQDLQYKTIEVTVDGSRLVGSADGDTAFVGGDVIFTLPFSAVLEGGPDTTLPFLVAPNLKVSSPFTMVYAFASEPVPTTSTARLVATDGSHIDLVPNLSSTREPKTVQSFSGRNTVLHYGVSYDLRSDGLVDFAGLAGESDAPLRVGMIATPPLIAEDGFESATGDAVGGATVVRDPELPPIAGTTSVYVSGPATLAPAGVAVGKGLFVRLPRQASDTKVRFSYRVLATIFPASFAGQIFAGTVDGPIAKGAAFPIVMEAKHLGTGLFAGDVQTGEIPLEDSVAGEVIVSIQPVVNCGFSPPPTGLLIDDLRAE